MDVKIAAFVYLYMLVCVPLMHVCVCVWEKDLYQQQLAPVSARHRQHLICQGEKECVPPNSTWTQTWFFSFLNSIFSSNLTISFPGMWETEKERKRYTYTQEGLSRYELRPYWDALWISTSICFSATLSLLPFHKHPLGTSWHVCFLPTCQGFPSTCSFNDPDFSLVSLPSLVHPLALSLSRCIFITPCTSPIRPPPLDNLSLYLLSGLFTEVSVQSSSSSPPLFLSL